MKATAFCYLVSFATLRGIFAANSVPIWPRDMYIGTAVDPGSIHRNLGFHLRTGYIPTTADYESAKRLAMKEKNAIMAEDAYVYVIPTRGLESHFHDIHSAFRGKDGSPKQTYDNEEWTFDDAIQLNSILRVDVWKPNGRKVIVLRNGMERAAENVLDHKSPYYGRELKWPLDPKMIGQTTKVEGQRSKDQTAIQID
ncbi:uncharacterized protein PgNI_09183 [Pyricularia grisea]|uniref:Uncharacterized protein n=1 Tax=Pyricularia grisea TaxID=148305 RepID=A0A6P8ATH8_PYRGI|nr:uncharacterized protein PgNI_09183 [Pyricularia grisea]TLD05436.1 hypothetical protein PgNI_09183 [Pyricularia grisea]